MWQGLIYCTVAVSPVGVALWSIYLVQIDAHIKEGCTAGVVPTSAHPDTASGLHGHRVYRPGGFHSVGFQCGFLGYTFKAMGYDTFILTKKSSFEHYCFIFSNICQKMWLPTWLHSNFRSNTSNFRCDVGKTAEMHVWPVNPMVCESVNLGIFHNQCLACWL